MDDKELLQVYVGLINSIDDYLEYRYKGDSADHLRDVIMRKIDGATQKMYNSKDVNIPEVGDEGC